MAQITDVTTLAQAIVAWSDRQDANAEQLLQFMDFTSIYAEQTLRIRQNRSTVILQTLNNTVTLPLNFEELKNVSLYINGVSEEALEYLPWEVFIDEVTKDYAGQVKYFTMEGGQLLFSPALGDNTSIRISYYTKIPKLSMTNPTNWLVQQLPQVYLFGCLKYLYEFAMNDERAAYWENKFLQELSRIQQSHDLSEHRGSTLAVGAPRR